MWDCEHCGCQAVAASLEFCPQCFTPRAGPEPLSSSETASGDGVSDDTKEASVAPPAKSQTLTNPPEPKGA